MNKRPLSKLCLLRRQIKKLMQEKAIFWLAFNVKKILKSCRKFKIYSLLPKSVFCGYTSIITHFFTYFKMEWWFIKLNSYIMINRAEPFIKLNSYIIINRAEPFDIRHPLCYNSPILLFTLLSLTFDKIAW